MIDTTKQGPRLIKGEVWFIKLPPAGIVGGNGVCRVRLIDVRAKVAQISPINGIGTHWYEIDAVQWLERDENATRAPEEQTDISTESVDNHKDKTMTDHEDRPNTGLYGSLVSPQPDRSSTRLVAIAVVALIVVVVAVGAMLFRGSI